jgi:uncharacterized protein (DUF1810 family)
VKDPGADPHELERFVQAQAGVHDEALGELRAGRKRSHWMWFVFPQAEGLGSSATARHYAIRSLDEARAYLAHPLLGPRLVECTQAAIRLCGLTARQIFGTPDDLKFRSSMTLFERVAGPDSDFARALQKYFDGQRDPATLARLTAA